jgi:hypothetical protein
VAIVETVSFESSEYEPFVFAAFGASTAEELVAPVPGVCARFWPAFQISEVGSLEGACRIAPANGSFWSLMVRTPSWSFPLASSLYALTRPFQIERSAAALNVARYAICSPAVCAVEMVAATKPFWPSRTSEAMSFSAWASPAADVTGKYPSVPSGRIAPLLCAMQTPVAAEAVALAPKPMT